MANCASAGPPRLDDHTLVWGNPTVVSTSHNSSIPPRLEISARHLAPVAFTRVRQRSSRFSRCAVVLGRQALGR